MKHEFIKMQIWPTIAFLGLFTVLLGLIYPTVVTIINQFAFKEKAMGSYLYKNNQRIGSALIGQEFTSVKYFWSRPSATAQFPYNALASGGSNLGTANPVLIEKVKTRISLLQNADHQNTQSIPIDLVCASGSGLDPHISVAGANYQIRRVAAARNMSEKSIMDLVESCTEKRQWRVFGEPTVNVLKLNLALDEAAI